MAKARKKKLDIQSVCGYVYPNGVDGQVVGHFISHWQDLGTRTESRKKRKYYHCFS